MSQFPFRKPQLPSSFAVLFTPPDADGEEILDFVSSTRRIRLKGRFFREFHLELVPLLDGTRTYEEICAAVADTFAPSDLDAALRLLAEQNLLRDADQLEHVGAFSAALQPQINLFQAASGDPASAQRSLHEARVAVFGLGGLGASVVWALADCGTGQLLCADEDAVQASDLYLSSAYRPEDQGVARTEAIRGALLRFAPLSGIDTLAPLPSDDTAAEIAVRGCNLVINCLDPGRIAAAFRLNRACLAAGVPMLSGSCTLDEIMLGPTVVPHETACFMCYRMRVIAAAEDPEQAFGFEAFLDRHRRDQSHGRENTTMAVTTAANLLALEAVKQLTGVLPALTRGRVVVLNLLDMSSSTQLVLRKPWCPACWDHKPSSEAARVAG